MLQNEIFVLKGGFFKNRFSSSAVSSCEIATLDHETFDEAVEDRTFVVQRLTTLTQALLTGA